MQLGLRGADMSRGQKRVPVLQTLPMAYFVDGDTGLKRTTRMAWANKNFDAEELACIVLIPEAVLDDADYDIWEQVKPRIEEAMGAAFDAAVLFGTGAPPAWPDDLLTGSAAAGNTVSLASITTGGGNIYDALLAEQGARLQRLKRTASWRRATWPR